MSQRRSVHQDSISHKGSARKKNNKKSCNDPKQRENIIRKLHETFREYFDLALIASVAHTCQWDVQRATEALLILSGRKTASSSKESGQDEPTNKAKSLPGTLKQEKSDRKQQDVAHYSSTNSLSSGQVWQRHYKSKPQSPGLLTMIPPHNKEVVKLKAPSSNRSSFKSSEAELRKASVMVKKIQQMVKNGVKVMILMRGVPGSGKTHLAQIIVSLLTENEFGQHIMSTDDYFIMLGRGNYAYDYKQLPRAHNWNQKRVSESLKRGINPVVVDNTNIQAWEMKPYVAMAVEHGYEVEVLEPVTEWREKEGELAKRNIHSVPREKIRQMLERYEPGWTGEKLIKSFGLKCKQPGSESAPEEVVRPSNYLLAQHRQHSTISVPEKPKRKKNSAEKKERHQLVGVEITEDKEKQLEELNKFFAEYGKTMDPVSRQKVLESGVPISKVVSRMRQLQGNILPLPQHNSTHKTESKQFNDSMTTEPNYPRFRRDSFTESGLLEQDMVSSSNASETSECETDTDAELCKWNQRYIKDRPTGHFVNGEDRHEDNDGDDDDDDDDDELVFRGKREKAMTGKSMDSLGSCKQDETLSLIDFDSNVTPISFSQDGTIATRASLSQDDLSLLNYDGTENTTSRDSSSSSEEQETQMLSLQESLREALLENNKRSHEMYLDSCREQKSDELTSHSNFMPNSKALEVDLSDSLMNVLSRRYDMPTNQTVKTEPESQQGGVSINESLLQILVKKYSSDEVEDSESVQVTTCKTDIHSTSGEQPVKSPDLEGVPLPGIPPDGTVNHSILGKTKSNDIIASETANFHWERPKSDTFEDIVNSWEHTTASGPKIDTGPKEQRCKNSSLGAIKKTNVNSRDKSPDELLRSVDLSWSSVAFASSWENLNKKATETQQKRSKCDSWTNTCHSDFDLWKKDGGGIPTLIVHSRNINQDYREPEVPTHKHEILMLDKSSMTSDTEETDYISKDGCLDTLTAMFPDISKDHLVDILDKCKGNVLWAIEVLLETPQNLANLPANCRDEEVLPSYQEAKVNVDDADYISLQNVTISDGKKTIKRRKDKKNAAASDLSLLLKKQIEESIQINEEFYQDKTLFLKKMRHGGFDEPIQPISHEWVDKYNEVEAEEDEETIPMQINSDFFKTLTELFGPGNDSEKSTESISPVINIPLSLAQQIYDCWVESVNKQVEDMQDDYVKMLMEDELLAKAFQEQEFEYRQPELREIMDMELAMLLYKQNQAHMNESLRETIATKLSKQLLFEAYPKMDKKMLLDLFESQERSFQKTVEILSAQENQSPITVVAFDFLETHGNKLLEQAKLENFKKNVEGIKKPVIVVKPHNTKKEVVASEKDVLLVNPIEYRQKTAQLHQQRNECCRLAQEAFRKKSYSVASYFSHIAALYKDRIKELSKEPFPSTIFDDKMSKGMTKIDLHFLLVPEALQLLDLFLDHHIRELRRKGLSSLTLDLITGRGQHSFKGKSKLKPAVFKRLEHRQLSFDLVNPGKVKVTVHKNDLLSAEM